MSNIIRADNELSFQEIPEYATTALWIEWYRARRKKPPENMICTTGESYQSFCKQCNVNPEDFPCIFVSREVLADISGFGGVGLKRDVFQKLNSALDQWDESDKNVYVAFIYEGARQQSLIHAVVRKLEGA